MIINITSNKSLLLNWNFFRICLCLHFNCYYLDEGLYYLAQIILLLSGLPAPSSSPSMVAEIFKCRLYFALLSTNNCSVVSFFFFFFSVAMSCPTFCNPIDCSTPGFPVLYHLPEFSQNHVHWVSDAIQLSHPLSHPLPPALNIPASGSSPISWLFTSSGQSIEALASVLVLPMNIQS